MEQKKSKNVWLGIMGVLILAELVATLLNIGSMNIVRSICKIVSLAFIALYGFCFYKKPHGNMLKYAMLILAASEIILAARSLSMGADFYTRLIWLFMAAILVYVSGRLNRIEQNKYLLGLAALIHLVGSCYLVATAVGRVDALRLFTWFSGAISVITLMIAYIVRYKEHKEAGLADGAKEK